MKKFLIMIMSVLFLVNIVNLTVNADDDDHDHERKKYDYYKEKWSGDDDDDDDDEPYYYSERMDNSRGESSHWYLWTRMMEPVKGEVPFSEPKNITFQNNATEKQLSLYSIPMDGEILIPGKRVSEFLGAKAVFYPVSQILEIRNVRSEFLYRVGTNVTYENKIKTPIPAKALFFNGDVYLPISVVANSLNFSVEWDKEQQLIYLQKMNQ